VWLTYVVQKVACGAEAASIAFEIERSQFGNGKTPRALSLESWNRSLRLRVLRLSFMDLL